MGNSGSAPNVTMEEARRVFAEFEQPCTPVTTTEAAAALECSQEAAERTLGELEADGAVYSRDLEDGGRVWWQTPTTGTDIVGERQAELAQFGAFVHAVKDYAIFMLDPDGQVVSWNDGAERIKGYNREEILGEHFSVFYPEEACADGVPDQNLETAATEGRVEDEGWRVRKDGTRFWADVVITAIRGPDGSLEGFTKVTRERTEQREYEKELRQERNLTQRILETVPVSISVLKPDGEFVDANSRTLERLGIDEAALGEYSAELWALFDEVGDPIPDAELPWRQAVDTGTPVYDFECQVELPDIGSSWLSINAVPLDARGRDDGLVVLSVQDITDQKNREQELRREQNQTEELLRTAPVAVSVEDADGNTILANERAQEVVGYPDEGGIEDILTDDDWQVYDADGNRVEPDDTPPARVRQTGEPVGDVEFRIETPDGARRWFSVHAAPVLNADGEVERVITIGKEITDIKTHEQELETELSEILGRISDAFYALDTEWRFTHVNEQAEELLQQNREALLGEKIWEIFPQAEETGFKDRFQEAWDQQKPVNFEVQYEALDAWVEVNAYPSETGLSVYSRDVTERREHELELEQYRTIVRTVNDGIYTVSPDGTFTMVNEAYADLTGYTREELIGSDVSMVVDEDIASQAQSLEEDIRAGEPSQTMIEAELKTASGDHVPAEARFALLPSEDNEHERVGVVRDITERREQQRALEESERRYRTLVENFPNGAVGLFDEELEYTAIGGEIMEDLGVDPEERVGSSVYEIYPDDLVREVEPYFQAALDGEANAFETEYRDRHLLAYTLPIRDSGDEVYAGMLVVQDITDLKETQRRLEESNERLEQFAYAASHDLQEPLRMVSSYLQLIEQRYGDALDEDGREFIDFAVDGADRMREMIEGLLEYSRVETEGKPFEPVDLDDVLDDVRNDLAVQIQESNAEITTDSLPRVEADPSQLRQVFQNLVSNAIEYSGDAPPQIQVTAERDGRKWVVSVTDEGEGIEPDATDRIFDVFERLHGHEDHPGTGIGLALCERIIERHDGDIWVESTPGEGATFSFTLPAAGPTAN